MNEATLFLGLSASPLVYFVGRTPKLAFLSRWLALVTVLVMGAWLAIVSGGTQTYSVGVIAFHLDTVSFVLSSLALLLALCVILYSFPYMAGRIGEEKYYAGIIMMTGAMIGLAATADLFNLWIWFELMTLSSYLLVMIEQHDHPAALEAGLKYLVQSAVGSVLILFGIAVVIAQTGTTVLDQISLAQPLALALFVTGFGVKIALVPLHMWLPDAHSQAPGGISALLSGVVIEAALVALLRVLATLDFSTGLLLMAFGAVNMLFGNLLALPQKEVKRMLAYSSLSHMGYILLGMGIGLYASEGTGMQAGFFHLFNHGLMKGLAFLAAGALLYALHHHSGKKLTIADLSGAARRYPVTVLTFTIALLGLGGLPPLAGFMSKWQIFVAGFETQNLTIAALVIFAAFNSVLSLVYYIPLINMMYRQERSEEVVNGHELPTLMVAPLVGLAVAIIVIGILPLVL